MCGHVSQSLCQSLVVWMEILEVWLANKSNNVNQFGLKTACVEYGLLLVVSAETILWMVYFL